MMSQSVNIWFPGERTPKITIRHCEDYECLDDVVKVVTDEGSKITINSEYSFVTIDEDPLQQLVNMVEKMRTAGGSQEFQQFFDDAKAFTKKYTT